MLRIPRPPKPKQQNTDPTHNTAKPRKAETTIAAGVNPRTPTHTILPKAQRGDTKTNLPHPSHRPNTPKAYKIPRRPANSLPTRFTKDQLKKPIHHHCLDQQNRITNSPPLLRQATCRVRFIAPFQPRQTIQQPKEKRHAPNPIARTQFPNFSLLTSSFSLTPPLPHKKQPEAQAPG